MAGQKNLFLLFFYWSLIWGSLFLQVCKGDTATPWSQRPFDISQRNNYNPNIETIVENNKVLQLAEDVWKGIPSSFSVIIPAHNSAPYIERTLDSVERSISYFQQNHPQGLDVKAEVVIIDDASTDNTVAVTANWIAQRAEKQNARYIQVILGENLYGGAARNFGIRESTGEILFFLDSDDLYYESHIIHGIMALILSNAAAVRLPLKVDVPDIHPGWIDRIATSLTQTKVLWRRLHDHIEGFPEQGVFHHNMDVAYWHAITNSGVRVQRVKGIPTVEYVRYPDNNLDVQIEKFRSAPILENLSGTEKTASYAVRMEMMFQHVTHLFHKAAQTKDHPQNNPHWAIYQNAADLVQQSGRSWTELDFKRIRYKRLLIWSNAEVLRGAWKSAARSFRETALLTYNQSDASVSGPFLSFVI